MLWCVVSWGWIVTAEHFNLLKIWVWSPDLCVVRNVIQDILLSVECLLSGEYDTHDSAWNGVRNWFVRTLFWPCLVFRRAIGFPCQYSIYLKYCVSVTMETPTVTPRAKLQFRTHFVGRLLSMSEYTCLNLRLSLPLSVDWTNFGHAASHCYQHWEGDKENKCGWNWSSTSRIIGNLIYLLSSPISTSPGFE